MKNFKCQHCGKEVSDNQIMGTENRNHCPFCLWSKHVDEKKGDRKSSCSGSMQPIGLTFKEEGVDKYGKKKQGELMLIHKCETCGKISINRIAGDDLEDEILKIFEKSKLLKGELPGVKPLGENDESEVKKQLFGK